MILQRLFLVSVILLEKSVSNSYVKSSNFLQYQLPSKRYFCKYEPQSKCTDTKRRVLVINPENIPILNDADNLGGWNALQQIEEEDEKQESTDSTVFPVSKNDDEYSWSYFTKDPALSIEDRTGKKRQQISEIDLRRADTEISEEEFRQRKTVEYVDNDLERLFRFENFNMTTGKPFPGTKVDNRENISVEDETYNKQKYDRYTSITLQKDMYHTPPKDHLCSYEYSTDTNSTFYTRVATVFNPFTRESVNQTRAVSLYPSMHPPPLKDQTEPTSKIRMHVGRNFESSAEDKEKFVPENNPDWLEGLEVLVKYDVWDFGLALHRCELQRRGSLLLVEVMDQEQYVFLKHRNSANSTVSSVSQSEDKLFPCHRKASTNPFQSRAAQNVNVKAISAYQDARNSYESTRLLPPPDDYPFPLVGPELRGAERVGDDTLHKCCKSIHRILARWEYLRDMGLLFVCDLVVTSTGMIGDQLYSDRCYVSYKGFLVSLVLSENFKGSVLQKTRKGNTENHTSQYNDDFHSSNNENSTSYTVDAGPSSREKYILTLRLIERTKLSVVLNAKGKRINVPRQIVTEVRLA